jgi:hypothetical protein
MHAAPRLRGEGLAPCAARSVHEDTQSGCRLIGYAPYFDPHSGMPVWSNPAAIAGARFATFVISPRSWGHGFVLISR